MPLVSYSDGGYVQTGGEYYFIVGPTSDTSVLQGDRRGYSAFFVCRDPVQKIVSVYNYLIAAWI